MNSPTRPISVLDPISPAIERVKDLLFRPFDLGRWMVIGFAAWLATLGENGGGTLGGNSSGHPRNGNFNDFWNEMTSYVSDNLSWIVFVAMAVVVVTLAVVLLLTWVSSRGRFIFLHDVATGRAEVVAPWNAYAAHANSLFLFRVGVGLLGMCLIAPFLGAGLWALVGMLRREEIAPLPMAVAAGALVVTLVLGTGFLVIGKLTRDFVVPIMALRTPNCRTGWGEFLGLLRSDLGHFVLYLLFSLVLGFAIGVAVILCLMICCFACCLVVIPYVGTVVLLPVHVFLRAYSAGFLAQFGPGYDVFARESPPVAVRAGS